jgi:hypothetical protein
MLNGVESERERQRDRNRQGNKELLSGECE